VRREPVRKYLQLAAAHHSCYSSLNSNTSGGRRPCAWPWRVRQCSALGHGPSRRENYCNRPHTAKFDRLGGIYGNFNYCLFLLPFHYLYFIYFRQNVSAINRHIEPQICGSLSLHRYCSAAIAGTQQQQHRPPGRFTLLSQHEPASSRRRRDRQRSQGAGRCPLRRGRRATEPGCCSRLAGRGRRRLGEGGHWTATHIRSWKDGE
jgi:hypothetical protein